MLGIIIGIGAVILIMSIGHGFQRHVIKNLMSGDQEEVSFVIEFMPKGTNIYAESNVKYFKDYELKDLEKIDGIKKARYTKQEDNTQIIAEFTNLDNAKEVVYVDLVKEEEKTSLPGEPFGRRITAKSSELRLSAKNWRRNFRRTGQLHRKGSKDRRADVHRRRSFKTSAGLLASDVQIPVATYYFYASQAASTSIELILEKGASIEDIQNKAVTYLEKHGSMSHLGSYNVYNVGQMLGGISTILDALTIFISLIAAISLLIAGIGMMNMMFISVSERTKEIGIRRALGATKKEIKVQFMLEGIIVTTVGGILGYILGMALGFIASSFLPFSVMIETSTIALALGVSMAIGIVFSYSPARNAAEKNVIEII